MAHPEPVAGDDDRIKAALWFAARGFGVFPCWSAHADGTCRCPRGKDCTSPGKHPLTEHGFKDATRDEKRIRTFLSAASHPNYGLLAPEGVFILDVDGDGWEAKMADLERRHGPLPPTLRTQTRNGIHVFLRWPEAYPQPLRQVFGWVTRWGNGYVIGPRSIHPTGFEYSPVGDVFDIGTLPDAWARAALNDGVDTIRVGGRPDPSTVAVGGRHEALRDTARFYAGTVRDPDALFAAVWAYNEKLPQPKTVEEVHRAIGDALTKYPADPVEEDPETGEVRRVTTPDAGEVLDDDERAPFPEPPDRAAFGGMAGEIVASIIDGTDVSEVGLLASVLTFAGVLAPSRTYVLNRNHVSVLHTCLVGDSTVGRKTTTMDRARDTFDAMVNAMVVNRVVMTGTNSGEALVTSLERRQLDYKREPVAALIYEQEYATLLAAASREASSLDSRLRVAFDGTQSMANRKQAGTQEVKPPYWLAALVGITPAELQRRAPAGVLTSGSANRWLWLPVEKRPGRGDSPPDPSIELRKAVAQAHGDAWEEPRSFDIAPGVRALLAEYTNHLESNARGQAVDLTKRFPTIAVRVAMIHATLDGARELTTEHVSRGIALTEYAHEGIAWAWGYSVGDKLAMYILRDLVASGSMTKRDITQRWCRDQMRAQETIDELRRLRFVETVKVRGTGGRPRTEVRLRGDHARFVRFVQLTGPEPRKRQNAEKSQETHGTQQTHGMHETSRTEGATAVWAAPCRDYANHQDSHRQTPEGWVCTTCEEEA